VAIDQDDFQEPDLLGGSNKTATPRGNGVAFRNNFPYADILQNDFIRLYKKILAVLRPELDPTDHNERNQPDWRSSEDRGPSYRPNQRALTALVWQRATPQLSEREFLSHQRAIELL